MRYGGTQSRELFTQLKNEWGNSVNLWWWVETTTPTNYTHTNYWGEPELTDPSLLCPYTYIGVKFRYSLVISLDAEVMDLNHDLFESN